MAVVHCNSNINALSCIGTAGNLCAAKPFSELCNNSQKVLTRQNWTRRFKLKSPKDVVSLNTISKSVSLVALKKIRQGQTQRDGYADIVTQLFAHAVYKDRY